MSKPPFRVPSMADVAAVPPNGFTAASTFSGCGGSSLGYRMAGFRVLWASEFVEAARDVYKLNAAPGTVVDDRDIRDVSAENVLSALGMRVGELDLIDGSPPCSSFSTSGRRHEGWGQVKTYSDTAQRSDDLFFEFARLVSGVLPRVFVAENVSGLIKGTSKGYFKEIMRLMKSAGYRVEARLLDSQWLGVPQARQRVIFVGVRNDLGLSPAHPAPLPYRYAVRDVLPPAPAAGATTTDPETGEVIDISRFAIRRDWDYLTAGGPRNGRRYQSSVLAVLNRPSPTITATGGSVGAAGVMHPTEPRKFTLVELRRICGFPADFTLTGTYPQRWERLGRAVPPVMMSYIAATVRDEILGKAA